MFPPLRLDDLKATLGSATEFAFLVVGVRIFYISFENIVFLGVPGRSRYDS